MIWKKCHHHEQQQQHDLNDECDYYCKSFKLSMELRLLLVLTTWILCRLELIFLFLVCCPYTKLLCVFQVFSVLLELWMCPVQKINFIGYAIDFCSFTVIYRSMIFDSMVWCQWVWFVFIYSHLHSCRSKHTYKQQTWYHDKVGNCHKKGI